MPSKSKKSKSKARNNRNSKANNAKKTKSRNNRNSKSRNNRNSKANKSLKCPPNMTPINANNELLCVGKCPHSGGPIYYNPKLDKLVCKWHGSQFTKQGKVLMPPATSNVKVKKLK